MRDITSLYEPLRAYTTALQNKVNVTARATIIASIEKGNVNDAKWWIERFDHPEPQISPCLWWGTGNGADIHGS